MQISDEDFFQQYPELHHYTTFDGLQGILRSNSIWATKFNALNDRSEIIHFRDRLIPELAEAIKPLALKLRGESFSQKRKYDKAGGLYMVALNEARNYVNAFYSTSFFGNPGSTPFAVPYISSFCCHSNDSAYEQANGLLSQWRGYATTEPCAIVFDSKEISKLLRKEITKYDYAHLQVSKVTYNSHDLAFSSEYSEIIEGLSKALSELFVNGKADDQKLNTTMIELLSATTRFKHRGFMEEREVRIVACPKSSELNEKFIAEIGIDAKTSTKIKPTQSRKFFNSDGSADYIALFDTLKKKIPIKRIIIGPCKEQSDLTKKIRTFVGNNIEIRKSETPFIN